MNLFCFTSKNIENIRRARRALEAMLWAVARVSDALMRGRQTTARRYFNVGSIGLIYCSATHTFTTPFEAMSVPDPDRVVLDVWPEPWVLPFSIRALGGLDRQMPADLARELWPFARSEGGAPAAMFCDGTQTFTPKPVTENDWKLILEHLATA